MLVQVPDVDGILDRLLLFLGYDKDYVTAETLIQVRCAAPCCAVLRCATLDSGP